MLSFKKLDTKRTTLKQAAASEQSDDVRRKEKEAMPSFHGMSWRIDAREAP
jgi:hypothetical protein